MVEVHARVRQSESPNFMKARIPIQTQLKVPAWKKYLQQYWDKQLIDLIHFGFPLDFDSHINLKSTQLNHHSALQYPDHVSKYLHEEINYGAICGPFTQLTFPCHISSFLSRDKPHSKIVELYWILASHQYNLSMIGIGSYFELKYSSVDDIVSSITEL